jgi:hypothetical protein
MLLASVKRENGVTTRSTTRELQQFEARTEMPGASSAGAGQPQGRRDPLAPSRPGTVRPSD